ncbi:hypothetical protein RFI_09574 [Reticulomyxa filosa]|uniref:Uncharacterized protein n=1 Tax=Reticulomyxa filosa TaxID=46433 RepID=X6NNI8_RETFI|nr:hypothetical protein RFI_09574 [Reticulomyxa filosa]|eukprot:ETO27561.1 hypothetical protein RFI_09574 [Reticulomyxa filosa]
MQIQNLDTDEDIHVMSKLNVQEWSRLAAEELKKEWKVSDFQREQVRWVFLVIEEYPSMRSQFLNNPKLILGNDFRQKAERLKEQEPVHTGSNVRMGIRMSGITAGNTDGGPETNIPPHLRGNILSISDIFSSLSDENEQDANLSLQRTTTVAIAVEEQPGALKTADDLSLPPQPAVFKTTPEGITPNNHFPTPYEKENDINNYDHDFKKKDEQEEEKEGHENSTKLFHPFTIKNLEGDYETADNYDIIVPENITSGNTLQKYTSTYLYFIYILKSIVTMTFVFLSSNCLFFLKKYPTFSCKVV